MDKKKIAVLFVDDDVFLTDMYALKFTGAGHTIRVAHSAEAALEILRGGFEADAIVTDLIMPTMSGFELIETMDKEKLVPQAARIVLSNQGEKSDLERLSQLGVTGNIVKANAIPSEVLALVEKYVQKAQQ